MAVLVFGLAAACQDGPEGNSKYVDLFMGTAGDHGQVEGNLPPFERWAVLELQGRRQIAQRHAEEQVIDHRDDHHGEHGAAEDRLGFWCRQPVEDS